MSGETDPMPVFTITVVPDAEFCAHCRFRVPDEDVTTLPVSEQRTLESVGTPIAVVPPIAVMFTRLPVPPGTSGHSSSSAVVVAVPPYVGENFTPPAPVNVKYSVMSTM